MRCQKTHEGDIPALSRLWKQAFGDTDEEINRFFREAYPHASGFAARDGETLVGMCFALPQQLACGEDACSAAYLYAVATDEHWRGQGVCRTLLAFAEKELKKRGTDCLMLVPADEGLAAMYEKLGFSGALRRESEAAAPSAAGQAEQVTPIEYAGLRETLLWDVPHVRYSKAWLEYEALDAAFYALRLGSASGCAAVRKLPDGSARVDELLPDNRMLPALAQAVGAARYRLPQAPYAMCKWLTARPAGWENILLGFDFA